MSVVAFHSISVCDTQFKGICVLLMILCRIKHGWYFRILFDGDNDDDIAADADDS